MSLYDGAQLFLASILVMSAGGVPGVWKQNIQGGTIFNNPKGPSTPPKKV